MNAEEIEEMKYKFTDNLEIKELIENGKVLLDSDYGIKDKLILVKSSLEWATQDKSYSGEKKLFSRPILTIVYKIKRFILPNKHICIVFDLRDKKIKWINLFFVLGWWE